jgi:hypothetical protein
LACRKPAEQKRTKQKGKLRFPSLLPFIAGAGDESRTRDLNLGKVALYQLSYSRAILQPLKRASCSVLLLHYLKRREPTTTQFRNFRTPLRILERETSLELATSTLARLRSTN